MTVRTGSSTNSSTLSAGSRPDLTSVVGPPRVAAHEAIDEPGKPSTFDNMDQRVGCCSGPDGENIAYAVVGQGPVLVLAAWWTSHLELDWQNEELRSFILGLAENHTVVRYDRSGVGMSDRGERAYDLDHEAAQLGAVIDAVGADSVDLLGISCGGPPCVQVAVERPDQIRHLVFFGSYLDGRSISDADTRDALRGLVAANWGLASQTLTSVFLPDSHAVTARRFASVQRHTATSEVATELLQLTFNMDVSTSAPSAAQPALVLHRTHDQVIERHCGEQLASALPNAEFRALEGRAHLPWAERPLELVAYIERFLLGATSSAPTRQLATVMFLDIVDSTTLLDQLGDQVWRQRLDVFQELLTAEIAHCSGRIVKDTGDGALVVFDLPGDAIDFATVIRRRSRSIGLALRSGIHTGEIEIRGDDITGRAVVVASRVCDLADADVVLVSGTTVDLAAGRGFRTEPRGDHSLKGIPGPVPIHEAEPLPGVRGRAGDGRPRFERSGTVWTVTFEGSETSLPNSKGIQDLATLCARPGEDVDVTSLMDGVDAPTRSTGFDVLDRDAIEAYRTRLGVIEVELDDADAVGDSATSERLDGERAALIEQLRSASGLGQRTRRMGDDVERARKAVSARVRAAIDKIAESNPSLSDHLHETISTGRYCRYD